MMGTSNDRFPAAATAELHEAVPFQTPAKPGSARARTFESSRVTPTMNAYTPRPEEAAAIFEIERGDFVRTGKGLGGATAVVGVPAHQSGGRYGQGLADTGRRSSGSRSYERDVLVACEPVHVSSELGQKVVEGKRVMDDAVSQKKWHHKQHKKSETTTAAQQQQFSPLTPPLASLESSRGAGGKRNKKKGRGDYDGLEDEPSFVEEGALVLLSLEEARREFETQDQSVSALSADYVASLVYDINDSTDQHWQGEEEERAMRLSPRARRPDAAAAAVLSPEPIHIDSSFVEDFSSHSPSKFGSTTDCARGVVGGGAVSPPPEQPACPPATSVDGNGIIARRGQDGAVTETAAAEGRRPREDEHTKEEGKEAALFSPPSSPSSGLSASTAAAGRNIISNSNAGSSSNVNFNSLDDEVRPPRVRFDFSDEVLGLEGTTMVTPEILGRPDLGARPDLRPLAGLGGRVGSGGDSIGGSSAFTLSQGIISPVSAYSQVLHLALAFVVLVLVAFAKAGDGEVCAEPYRNSRGGFTGDSSSPSSSSPSPSSSSSSSSSSSGRRASRGSSNKSTRQFSAKFKRHRISGSGGGLGWGFSSFQSSAIVRRIRAAWSKLWHVVEDDLTTRWRAAGHALASLRRSWAALWVPPPHVEADVLAEALASPLRGGDDHRRRRVTGAAGGGAFEHGDRRRSSKRGSRGGALRGADSPNEKGYTRRPVGIDCLNLLGLCGYRPLTRPGGRKGSRAAKFLLVLDLDETLVHCSSQLMEPSRRRSAAVAGGRSAAVAGGRAVTPDLELEMRGKRGADRPGCMYAWKRPHLDVFLDVVSRWYEVAVFTAGRQCFAEPLIDLIDSRCVIEKRFYRGSCTRRNGTTASATIGSNGNEAGAGAAPTRKKTAGGAARPAVSSKTSETIKDLRVVGSEHFPLRTVLVDNQPQTVLQQANVLPVKSWFPTDSDDRQLLDLLPVLLALTSCQDVRSVLSLRPGVDAATVRTLGAN